ncbi:MAG: regulator of sigma protease [Chloroflexota bacterium]|jgi:regulator of sigma E protease|nr:regulator of sigma protease [Chloroflexota bacterium]
MSLLSVLAFVVVFGGLVTMHELGHFTIAKLNGVKVIEFSVGFGMPLIKVTRGETQYSLRSIPLGGYVRLAGMDDQESGPRSFNSKPVWRRLSIIAAGAVTNLVLPIPILLLAAVLQSGPVTVLQLTDQSPAMKAGIPLKAEIVQLDDHPVSDRDTLRHIISSGGGKPLKVEYRDPSTGHLVQKTLTPEVIDGAYRIGVGTTPGGGYDLPKLVGTSVAGTYDIIKGTLGGFGAILSGHIPGGLTGSCGPSGPIGIVRATVAAADAGIASLLTFMAFLSVNLGILNLLPLPALDGGRLAFLVVEGVRRKPIDPAKEQRVHYVGLLVLLGFVLFISYNDVIRLGVPFSQLLNQCAG